MMAVSAFYLPASERGKREVSQINITPLVDVLLVLLVIFMVAAPAVTGRLDLRLSHATDRRLDTAPPPRVELHVQADGRYLLGGRTLSGVELPAALRALADANAQTVLQISVAQDADYQGFTSALSEAGQQGLANIALK